MIKKMLRRWLLDEGKPSPEPVIEVPEVEMVDEAAEHERLMDSDEPYCKVVGEGVVDGQLKLELDWNSAFIDFLLENGFTGKTDEEIVAKWMLMVHRELDESSKEADQK